MQGATVDNATYCTPQLGYTLEMHVVNRYQVRRYCTRVLFGNFTIIAFSLQIDLAHPRLRDGGSRLGSARRLEERKALVAYIPRYATDLPLQQDLFVPFSFS